MRAGCDTRAGVQWSESGEGGPVRVSLRSWIGVGPYSPLLPSRGAVHTRAITTVACRDRVCHAAAPMNYARRDDASLMANADGAPMCTRKRRQVKLLCNFFTVICEITTSVTKPVMNAIPRPRTAEENPYWLPPGERADAEKDNFLLPRKCAVSEGRSLQFSLPAGHGGGGRVTSPSSQTSEHRR